MVAPERIHRGLEAQLDQMGFPRTAVLPGREAELLEDPAYGVKVPEVSYDFLANAVDQGTFPHGVARRATAINGVSVVVGRGRSFFCNPDRLHMLIKLPPEPRTFKLVIGWRDHDNRGNGNGGGGRPSR